MATKEQFILVISWEYERWWLWMKRLHKKVSSIYIHNISSCLDALWMIVTDTFTRYLRELFFCHQLGITHVRNLLHRGHPAGGRGERKPLPEFSSLISNLFFFSYDFENWNKLYYCLSVKTERRKGNQKGGFKWWEISIHCFNSSFKN